MFGGGASPFFPSTSDICWQHPLSLEAEELPWNVTEMAALCKAADDNSDLSHLEGNSKEELAVEDPELEAIKFKLQEMEKEDKKLKELQLEAESHPRDTSGVQESERVALPLWAPGIGLFPKTTQEKVEADKRSVYVGNVDYGGTAEELKSHFRNCGPINRVTILCDKFSGHPKGYAYIEFEEKSSVKAAVELDESTFRERVIKVRPKRTNMPGISTTDRGGYQGHYQSWWGGYYRGQNPRAQGRIYRGRARLLPWYFPY